MRGGEGSLAGGGSLVTARSLAGEGEGGLERDMVGVGLSTPDTEGSCRDACGGTPKILYWPEKVRHLHLEEWPGKGV